MLAYSTDGIYLVASFGGLSILGLALLPHFFVIPRVEGSEVFLHPAQDRLLLGVRRR